MSPRFLVVDDERSILELFLMFLGRFFPDCLVRTADRPEKAFMIITEEFIPDIIISDIRMPGMDGMDFFRELRKKGFAGGWIFLTGTLFEKELKFMAENQLPCLQKPFDLKEVKTAIDKVLAH